MTDKERRENIAKAEFCRTFLHINGFLTDKENEKVFQRIVKCMNKYNVLLTTAQILSVDMTYNENAK